MKTKNVLFISPHTGNYGAERSLVTLIHCLNQKGWNTLLVIPQHGKIETLLQEKSIEYIIVKFYSWTNTGQGTRILYALGKAIFNEISSYKLKKLLHKKRFHADIVHTNVIITEFGLHIASKIGAKHIWHIREFGKLDFNMDFDFGDKISAKIMNKGDYFIAVSKTVMEYYYRFINHNKICYIYNGVNTKKNPKHNWLTDKFNLIMVGRISQEKGQTDAVLAIERLVKLGIHNIYLDIYGDGVDFIKIQTMIQQKELGDFINMKGFSNAIDYSKYHVGLVCSKCEAFGRVTVEYMMEGISVIGTNTGGSAELIHDQVGTLYVPGDSKILAEKILQLHKNRELCEKKGENARMFAEKNFNYDIYCNNIIQIYEKVLGR